MSRRKTRAQELARQWTKRKSQRQKRNGRRNKAEKAERAILSMDRNQEFAILPDANTHTGRLGLPPDLTKAGKRATV